MPIKEVVLQSSFKLIYTFTLHYID